MYVNKKKGTQKVYNTHKKYSNLYILLDSFPILLILNDFDLES